MDPLGITASILAILGITRNTIKYLDRIRQFSPTYKRLLEEVRGVETVLSDLKTLSHDSKADPAHKASLQCLQRDGHLAKFQSTVEGLCSRLESLLQQKNSGRALLWPLKETEIKDILASIERQKILCGLAIAGDHVTLAQQVRSKVLDLEQGMEKIGSRINQEQREETLQWLSAVQPSVKRQDVNTRHVSGTGQWFLDELRDWVQDPHAHPVIWCHGLPGAGKTDLFSHLVDSLLGSLVAGSETMITYF